MDWSGCPIRTSPEQRRDRHRPATIYSGNAGHRALLPRTGGGNRRRSYLDEARRGADQIAATWRDVLDFPSLIPLDHVNLDFSHGLSGTAFTLATSGARRGPRLPGRRAGDHPPHRGRGDRARRRRQLDRRAVRRARRWLDRPLSALGGAAIRRPSPARSGATRRGAHLKLAEPEPRGGLKWTGFPMETLGMSPDAYMPNFEFGTAGVAYVLARLAEETGDAALPRRRARRAPRTSRRSPRCAATLRCSTYRRAGR